jgi:hypothetical protein
VNQRPFRPSLSRIQFQFTGEQGSIHFEFMHWTIFRQALSTRRHI